MRAPTSELPVIAAAILARLRAENPRVHCITNAVAQNLTANTLLAVGAVPSMTIAAEELVEFLRSADALLINLGTPDNARQDATVMALSVAIEAGMPWVLDPVLIDRSARRTSHARRLIDGGPKAVRLNRSEFLALAGSNADAADIKAFASKKRTVIGLTGATDVVSDGARVARIENGHSLMARVTALGCAESALVAACLAVESDAWHAMAAALLIMGVAGEVAAKRARGPGSFAMEILDALHMLDRDTLIAQARAT